jgi:HK97 family phage portal protein
VPTLKDRFTAAIKAAGKAMRFGGIPALAYGAYGSTQYGYQWGRNVNYAQAVGDPLDNSIVAATVGWVGRTMPEAPIRVMKETAQGEEIVPAHPLTLKIKRPNPYYSGALMWNPLMISWIGDGNAYLIKERTNGGDVLSLWYVPHWTMEPKWTSPTEYVSYYEYKVDGVITRYDPKDVIHLRNGIDPRNTRKGLSQLKAVIREIYSDNMATQYSAAMLSNYGTPGMIISPLNPDQSFSVENAAVIKQNTIEKTTGDRRGEPIIFLDPVKVDIPAFSPQQMNVRDSQYTPEERISAVIGIPAIVVGLGAGLSRSTFSNTEQAYEAAYRSYLIPVQRMIAEELTTQLLPDFGGAADEFVQFDYTDIRALQQDETAVATRAGGLFQQGVIDRARAVTMIGDKPKTEDKGVYFLARGGSLVSGSLDDVGPGITGTPALPAAPATATPTNGHGTERVPANA